MASTKFTKVEPVDIKPDLVVLGVSEVDRYIEEVLPVLP
jgi:hypothetical protein